MKSERRHELQQNDLAIYLGKINRSIEPYSKLIAIVLGVLIVGAIGYGFYRSEQKGRQSEATLQLIQAGATQDAEVFLTVGDTYPNTAAGDWARLYQGQLYLSRGIQSLFNDRQNAEELLNDAQQALRAAIAGSSDRLLRSRGQFGIARAAEALGNVDEATEAYKEVIAINESEAMNKKAQERIDALSTPATKDFIAWFQDQDFSPADPSLPPALPSGDTLPALPDLNLPPLNLGGGIDGGSTPRDLEGGLELPEGDSESMKEDTTSPSESGIELPENADTASESAASSDSPSSPSETAVPETATEAGSAASDETTADESTPESGADEDGGNQ